MTGRHDNENHYHSFAFLFIHFSFPRNIISIVKNIISVFNLLSNDEVYFEYNYYEKYKRYEQAFAKLTMTVPKERTTLCVLLHINVSYLIIQLMSFCG